LFDAGSEFRVRNDDMPFVHVALAVEGCGWTDADNLPLMVASTLLGSWDRSHGGGPNLASRLASQCAKHNLCHSYQAFNTCYKDTGHWGVYFVADPMMQEVGAGREVLSNVHQLHYMWKQKQKFAS
jgi:processing peptidase subunit beta